METQLNEIIHNFLPYPEEINNSKLGWGQRVDLACALGLKNQYSAPLKKIWEIRNKFSHHPNVKLKKEWINELYDLLDDEDRKITLEAYEMTELKIKNDKGVGFNSLNHRHKFTLISTVLHSMLLVAVNETIKRHERSY